ncbi:MAG TPA: Gldg family protein [Stellaceae bacterium]|nr:Gldg family protein [Stellaceae bacterium]
MLRRIAWGSLWRSPRARSLAALACVAVMLVSVNIIAAQFLPQRFDLTAERLYTLSPGTRQTLARIDEPITLRFYYSTRLGETVPSYGVYAHRVRELLDQYVAAAHGKIRLEVYDPQPFSAIEDRAVAFGLQAVPLNAQGEQVYFGLAGTNSTDDERTIPFFAPQRERLLEYDLTRLVHTLAVPKRTVVGLISSLPLAGDPIAALQGEASRPMAVLQQLRQLDDVKMLPSALDAIPAGTDVLMLVHPQKLPAKTLFAIDQFVQNGGKALIFVDPYSEMQARGGPADMAVDSDLEPLFKAWGVRLEPNTVAADRRDARRVVVPTGAGGGKPLPYVAWLDLKDGELNRDDPITASLSSVTVASAGIIEPLSGATTTFEPLITTSPDAMKLPVDKVAGFPDVVGLLIHFKPTGMRYTLAAHITGPAETAFPDGPPKAAATPGKPAATPAKPAAPPAKTSEFTAKSAGPINVVVVADTDMLDDRAWAQSQDFFGRQVVAPLADNADFVANAIDVLSGGEELIGLRSRGSSVRPFEVVERIQRAADDRYAAKEHALEQKLKATQAKLRDLTTGAPAKADANTPLSPEQAKAVEQFRTDLLATRRALRRVREAQRQDIEQLKAILEFCDIALVPIVVALAAIVLGLTRRRRWRRRPSSALA